MSAPPSLFYHPAYWCHSCDMSIGLPPSPTPNSLLCPHCHYDSLEQMELEEEQITQPSPTPLLHDTLLPTDENFLLDSPYLHRLIDHLTANASPDASNSLSNPAPKAAIESLPEVAITPESDLTLLCPICKDPFVVNSVAKLMPCTHRYHSDCIVPWLEINNSCPICRFKLPVEEGPKNGRLGFVRLEELVGDELELYDFRNTLRHIARSHQWRDEATIGSGSERNPLSTSQIGEAERESGALEMENDMDFVMGWPRRFAEELVRMGEGNVDDDALART